MSHSSHFNGLNLSEHLRYASSEVQKLQAWLLVDGNPGKITSQIYAKIGKSLSYLLVWNFRGVELHSSAKDITNIRRVTMIVTNVAYCDVVI